jgi:hypothetical protein
VSGEARHTTGGPVPGDAGEGDGSADGEGAAGKDGGGDEEGGEAEAGEHVEEDVRGGAVCWEELGAEEL